MKICMIAIASFIAVASLSGCAFTTDKIELHYKQQQNATVIPGAGNVSVNVQVNDQRQDKTKVSSKKNGFGMETAPIIATEEVSVTIRSAIEQELKSRGFKLASNDALILIGADLTRFYNEHKMGVFAGDAVADLNMSVTVKSQKGDTLYSHQLIAQGTEKDTQLASGENAKKALEQALENGMKSLFEDQIFLTALTSASTPITANK